VEFTECSADSLREQEEEANLIQMLCNADFYALRSDKLKSDIFSCLAVRCCIILFVALSLLLLFVFDSCNTRTKKKSDARAPLLL
jgi:hypothetical protein